jgi:hypothetical protein
MRALSPAPTGHASAIQFWQWATSVLRDYAMDEP